MLKKILLILLFQCTGLAYLQAQIQINEYSASNLESYVDEFGKTEDWIELYNPTSEDIDLGGWFLSDKPYKATKFEIPANTIIPANGYLVFLCSGRNVVGTQNIHTNFKLTQTTGRDTITLTDPNENIVEQHLMQTTLVEHSICRATDGSDEWVISINPTYGFSNDESEDDQFTKYTAAPSMSLEAGFYDNSITVELTNNEPNSVLRYTTNGLNPTASSPEYTEPLEIDETTVVKARSYSFTTGVLPGKMEFNTYFIDENDFTVAVFSVAANDAFGNSVIDLANGDGEVIPIGTIEYFTKDKEREATSFGSLNRHGQDSWVLDHRSIDWISRDEMGYSKAVQAPLFSYSDRDEYQRFMFRNSGDDNYPAINDGNHEGSTHIRDEFVHTLAQEGNMDLDVRAVERVVVFLNGQYWGLYGMRERPVDHDYTQEYYNQGKYDIQYLSTWGDTEAEYGGQQALYDWEDLRNFILENDMSDSLNYAQVTSQYRVLSLIDYMLVNLNTVASDWLNYNTGWWRGLDPEGGRKKWGYIVWDLDATFDYYINYTGVPNTDPDAVPCDVDVLIDEMENFFGPLSNLQGDGGVIPDYSLCPSIVDGSCPYPPTDPNLHLVISTDNQWFNGFGCCEEWTDDCEEAYEWAENGWLNEQGNVGAHEKIFTKLLDESPEFSKLYYQRYADVMNTVYSCENMNETLDRMLAVIDPEMDRQIERWGGTREEWEQNVDDLKDFINERCILLDDGLVDCYEVTGPYNVTLMTEPDNIGEIDFNTLDIRTFPWTGDYFGGVENRVKARVFDEWIESYEFSHWESSSGNILFPDDTSTIASITFDDTDTLTAVFEAIWITGLDEIENNFAFNLFPNPTSDFLNLSYDLPEASTVNIELHSVIGNQIISLDEYNGNKAAGTYKHQVQLGDRIPAGMYFLYLNINDQTIAKKVNVIK